MNYVSIQVRSIREKKVHSTHDFIDLLLRENLAIGGFFINEGMI